MIHDYKSKIATNNRHRRRNRGRSLVFLVASGILASAFMFRHVDLKAAGPSEQSAQTAPITGSLALPPLPPASTTARKSPRPNPGGNTYIEPPLTRALETPKADPAAKAPKPTAEQEPAAQPIVAASLATAPAEAVTQVKAPGSTRFEKTTAAGNRPDLAIVTAPRSSPAGMAQPEYRLDGVTETPPRIVEHPIQRGDTLAEIFSDANLSPGLLHRIVNSGDAAANLAKIRPGQTLRLAFDSSDRLQGVTLQRSKVSSLHIEIEDDEIAAIEHSADLERRIAQTTGVIESSLFVDGQKAGLDDGLILELAAIFGWDIDFALEIRAGDRFSVVYEELLLNEEKIRNGKILAAEFVNRGVEHRAVRFAVGDGDVAYYDPEGRNKRRAFIRTPVKFARVSSRFTNRRWHPVLKKWRSHKGVDYAAPRGTPIKAAGNGRIIFKGKKGGYGRVIFIEHAKKYATVYGHMSRYARSLKAGSRVKQGQVIGYVGKSGLATGPHLHYEFRVNGVHRNPLTVKLPKSLPLPKHKLAAFRRATQPLLAKLNDLNKGTLLAESDHR